MCVCVCVCRNALCTLKVSGTRYQSRGSLSSEIRACQRAALDGGIDQGFIGSLFLASFVI